MKTSIFLFALLFASQTYGQSSPQPNICEFDFDQDLKTQTQECIASLEATWQRSASSVLVCVQDDEKYCEIKCEGSDYDYSTPQAYPKLIITFEYESHTLLHIWNLTTSSGRTRSNASVLQGAQDSCRFWGFTPMYFTRRQEQEG